MRNAPTLKAAILDLCTNQRRYVRGAVAYLLIQNETAFWGYAVHHPTMQSVEQISEGAMAVARNMLLELAGVPSDEVFIARRAPDDIAAYRQFFGYAPRSMRNNMQWRSLPPFSRDLFKVRIANCVANWKALSPIIGL